MSVFREAALSYFLQKLFDKLTSLDLLKIFNQEQFDADLKKWKTTLMKIRAVLDDVEEKQMTCWVVKIWLYELEDLAYDVEDILDEFATEALRHELIAEASTSKVLKLIPGCVGLNRNFVTFSARMLSKIKVIDTRLQEIVTQKNDLELKVKAQGMTKTTRSRLPSTSLVNEGSKIVVTTQNDRVSSTLGTAKAYKLKGLSNDACLTIFIQHALGTTDFSACPELEEIGQKISKRSQWAAGDSCYRLEDKLGGNKQFKISAKTLILKGCSHLTKLREKIGNLVNLRHLDITDALLIKEMPMGLKELKSLQTLSDFIVGKDTESKIGDLMNLEFLRGRLCISSLENVPNAKDARNANLNCKKNLDVLVMKWQFDDLQVARVAVDVLDMLRPPSMVKELFIEGYVGEKFPTWFGDPSFSNMVLLRIENCKNCTSLPAIGQLPSLKDVVIKGMAKVRSIGPEIYGKSCLKPFQYLEKLCFKNMQEWQD
nr:putative disease resistance rpp13-like protein 1 [Quercus suber]